MGRVYAAIGDRTHERGTRLARSAVEDALESCGFDVGLVDKAIDDETTMQTVRREHDAAVAEVGAFGVPTVVLPNGRGMFGPVLAVAPTGQRAGELWDHVEWLIEQRDFFELKRERDRGPGETG